MFRKTKQEVIISCASKARGRKYEPYTFTECEAHTTSGRMLFKAKSVTVKQL